MPKATAKFRWIMLSCAAALCFGSLSPAPLMADNRDEAKLNWPLALRMQILRLNAVEWRVRQAAGAICSSYVPGLGLSIDYIGAYLDKDQPQLSQELGMRNLPQISAVANSSPAFIAGIRPGDAIVSINGIATLPISPNESAKKKAPNLSPDGIMEWLQTLPVDQPIVMELKRGAMTLRKTVKPVPLCAGQAILKSDDALDAYSDSSDLAITTGLIAFTENDDELALVLGHELAHVILRHEPSIDAISPYQGGESLRQENEADIIGAQLAHCAGYNVQNGAAFWMRYNALDATRWVNVNTHAAPNERQHAILRAAPAFTCPVSLSALASLLPK